MSMTAKSLPRERFFVLLALAVGVVYRLLQYVSDRSFWLDEALAAAKYLHHSPAELMQPRHFGGVGPGFYLLQWTAAQALGTSELALRLPAFVAGVASVFLFLPLARRFLAGYAVPLAVGMFAVSPYLIYYTSEAKRYSLDVFFGIALLLLAERVHRSAASAGSVAAFVAGCVVAVFFSLPCAFVAAGTTLGLAWSFHRGGDRRASRVMLAVAGVAALLVGVPLLFFVGSVSGHGAAADFWKAGYMPFPPTSAEELRWYPATYLRTFGDPLGLIRNRGVLPVLHGVAGAAAFAVGLFALRRDRRALLPLLVMPLAVALLASALAVYPFGGSRATGGRTIMYLMPVFYLAMAAGVAAGWSALGAPLKAAGLVAALLLVAPPLAEAVAAVPYGRMEARSIISYVSTHRRPGDAVHVHYDLLPTFEFYRGRYGFREGGYTVGSCERFAPLRYVEQMRRYAPGTRVWILFAAGEGAYAWDEKGFILEYMKATSVPLDNRVALGASAYLFEVRAHPAPGQLQVRVPLFPRRADESCEVVKMR
jgi:hypothetical protein